MLSGSARFWLSRNSNRCGENYFYFFFDQRYDDKPNFDSLFFFFIALKVYKIVVFHVNRVVVIIMSRECIYTEVGIPEEFMI